MRLGREILHKIQGYGHCLESRSPLCVESKQVAYHMSGVGTKYRQIINHISGQQTEFTQMNHPDTDITFCFQVVYRQTTEKYGGSPPEPPAAPQIL